MHACAGSWRHLLRYLHWLQQAFAIVTKLPRNSGIGAWIGELLPEWTVIQPCIGCSAHLDLHGIHTDTYVHSPTRIGFPRGCCAGEMQTRW
jgi:hypothetical protein